MKYYTNGINVYRASSKKEVADFLDIEESSVKLIKDEDLSDKVIDISLEKRKKKAIEDAVLCSRFSNEPTRTFEPGEVVEIGNRSGFRVSGIFGNGRVYLIENSTDFLVVQWHQIQKIKNTTNKCLFAKKTFNLAFFQTTLESLLHINYFFGIDKNPLYQRDLVWSDEQKELLIDSIFNNRAIGSFVLIKLSVADGFGYEILDGKQRLSAILDFYEDRFSYNGVKYSELNEEDQRRFKRTNISQAEVEDDISLEKKVAYFVNLNITGTPVDRRFLEDLSKKYL